MAKKSEGPRFKTMLTAYLAQGRLPLSIKAAFLCYCFISYLMENNYDTINASRLAAV